MNLRFPPDLSLSSRDIRPTLRRIIFRGVLEANDTVRLCERLDVRGEILDVEFFRIAKVHGLVVVAVHERMQSIDEVADVLEGSRLFAVTVNGNILVLQGLDDEVGHHSSIVGMHAWSERVEDSCNPHRDVVLVVIRVHHGFGNPLPFIVAAAWADRVDVAPVRFLLRMLLRIAVNLARRGQQHASANTLGQTEHVQRSHR
mmetsp:Transcript_21878/g.62354  ORF Transcript_21878/g.62354 Transcript_21878/m.62354 type:complete len:201 (-) Transcript_21878:343-945(-)